MDEWGHIRDWNTRLAQYEPSANVEYEAMLSRALAQGLHLQPSGAEESQGRPVRQSPRRFSTSVLDSPSFDDVMMPIDFAYERRDTRLGDQFLTQTPVPPSYDFPTMSSMPPPQSSPGGYVTPSVTIGVGDGDDDDHDEWVTQLTNQLEQDGSDLAPLLNEHPEMLQEHAEAMRQLRGKDAQGRVKRAKNNPAERYCVVCCSRYRGPRCRTCS